MSTGQRVAFALMGIGIVGAVVFVALTLLDGCASPEAKYSQALAQCELAPTCAEAVACRAKAAAEAHRTFTGHCEPFAITGDAGKE